jgi:imidazolonepropionase-like amidohydrolase
MSWGRASYLLGGRSLCDGRPRFVLGMMVDGPQESLKATRQPVYRGAGVIKLSTTGGVYGRTEGESVTHTELSFDEINTVTSEAHKLGVSVGAHAIGYDGIRNCVKARVDTIEHGQQLTPSYIGSTQSPRGSRMPQRRTSRLGRGAIGA